MHKTISNPQQLSLPNPGKTILLPATRLAAIYDKQTKKLYLYAVGRFPKTANIKFRHDEHIQGGWSSFFEGYVIGELDDEEEENEFVERKDIIMDSPYFHASSVGVTVAGAPGEGPRHERVQVLKV